jgi:hypothetical protein
LQHCLLVVTQQPMELTRQQQLQLTPQPLLLACQVT